MSELININSQGEKINLQERRYRIYMLGGFSVKLGQFSISIRHKITNKIITSKKAFWPVQAYAFGKRAKRILILDVTESGEYEVIFNNPKSVKVKKSNLLILSLIYSFISTDKLEVIITKKLGTYPNLT